MKTQPTFFQALAAIFRPPFQGLAAAVWLYFAWCFLVHPDSAILRADFVDPDDPMLLAHMLDWLQGQSWFDLVQYRLNPPQGVPIHFSRLTELPVAALTLPLRWLGLSWTGASTLAAAFWPLALLGFLFAALRWLAECFVPPDWARVTAFIALFTPPLTFRFTPGQVDHHGLTALITTLALGCVVRLLQKPEQLTWAFGAGFCLAWGQTIALETLPWLLLMSGFLGLWVISQGARASRGGAVFGLALFVASALFLGVTKSPAHWLDSGTLAYSVVYVLLAACLAATFAALACVALGGGGFRARLGFGAALALGFAALFLGCYPELKAGPYGAMDPALSHLLFDNISEAQPLTTSSRSIAEMILRLLLPLLALGSAFKFMRAANGADRWAWALSVLLLAAAILLAAFYQVRVQTFAMLFSIVPLAALLGHGLKAVAQKWQGRKQAAAEFGLILLVGPLLTVLLPATVDSRPFNSGVLLFPVQTPDSKCQSYLLEKILNSPRLYGDRPRVLMNMLDEGPELLYRTKHSVLAAPYHTNVEANLDAVNFFGTSDPAQAESIVRAHKAELVVMCRLVPEMYLGAAGPNQIEAKNGKIVLKATASFAEQLIYNKVPPWLHRVDFPGLTNYLLFEVRPAKPTPTPPGIPPRS